SERGAREAHGCESGHWPSQGVAALLFFLWLFAGTAAVVTVVRRTQAPVVPVPDPQAPQRPGAGRARMAEPKERRARATVSQPAATAGVLGRAPPRILPHVPIPGRVKIHERPGTRPERKPPGVTRSKEPERRRAEQPPGNKEMERTHLNLPTPRELPQRRERSWGVVGFTPPVVAHADDVLAAHEHPATAATVTRDVPAPPQRRPPVPILTGVEAPPPAPAAIRYGPLGRDVTYYTVSRAALPVLPRVAPAPAPAPPPVAV